MKRLPLLRLVILGVTTAMWIVGCRSPQSPAEGTGEDLINRPETVDFDDPYGGFNMADEAPGFGDAALLAEFAGDDAFDDPMARDSEVMALSSQSDEQIFLMITWGNLHRDSTITHVTDWSGLLTVDPGAIILKRVIRFERNDMILPRTERDLLEWQSTTLHGVDGIVVNVLPAPQPDGSAGDAPVDSMNTAISFKTEPFSTEFTLKDLPDLDRIVTLDDGNAVAFTAVRITPSDCPHGFMHGIWRNHPERRGGVYLGRWATADGQVRGYMRGRYGVNSEGMKVFFGKMIDTTGRFEGVMKGEWGYGDGEFGGWFAGRWVDRSLEIRGGLKGEWRRSDRCHGGFYRGRWAKSCN